MIRRPPRSTQSRSSAASDVYKRQVQDGGRRHLGNNFKWPYLRNRSFVSLHVWFWGGVFGDDASNGAIFGTNKSTDLLEKFQMTISPQQVVRFTPCFVLGWGFRGLRIKWRYFRYEKIHRHLGKISNGYISATGRPIHSMFGSRVEFSADLMALLLVRKNPRWRPPPYRKKFQMAISP